MGGFVGFMQSAAGRLLRMVVGIALIGVGITTVGFWGAVLVAIGTIFFLVGALGICLVAPLFGYTLTGKRAPVA
jgi:uncharacterized membrane protein YiaA